MLAMMAAGPFVPQRIATVDVVGGAERGPGPRTPTGFIESGDVAPVIDRSYRFEDLPAAVGHQERGHVPGKAVIEVRAVGREPCPVRRHGHRGHCTAGAADR
ncbi:zinc-binding dehydrogenase [Nocardiopsis aegyptia]|uniref:Uncharacterized protein n=1 Tax=Nocardiopsis aegyptia TaxID=220378 RepID=A0A7Z0J7S6_9ACTN|nr:zinc-binding dehydrogenase [Nocardiopsis aegyptia]NYJ32343.1 hypothetical protein [Nocardiopsis aegyptia]